MTKHLSPVVTCNPEHFRPDTSTTIKEVNFVLTNGGIGDYICYLPALLWASKTQFHVKGNIYCPPYLLEVVTEIFKDCSTWNVIDRTKLTEDEANRIPTYIPPKNFMLNGTGCHLVDLGFVYFANMHRAPDNTYYPRLDPIAMTELSHFNLPSKYVVLTPGATEDPRQMPPKLFNAIQKFLLDHDMPIVYLGREEIANNHRASFHPEYNLTLGLNLINQTTILEAIHIMSHSKVVVGIDNGLLHLAALTPVPIVFGYTTISAKFRRPWRNEPAGPIIDISPDKATLPCTFCMEGMRYFFDHDFKNCIYKDLKCLKEHENGVQGWLDAVSEFI